MQYRLFQVLIKIWPLLIAGEASIFSFRLFVATRLNSGPGFTTVVWPLSDVK